MYESSNFFFDEDIHYNIKSRAKMGVIYPNLKKALSRYDSAIFQNNYNKNLIRFTFREDAPIKNIVFSLPNPKIKKVIQPKYLKRNKSDIRLRQFYKHKPLSQCNNTIKLAKNNNNAINKIRFFHLKNNNNLNKNIVDKPVNLINEKLQDKENIKLIKIFYCFKNRKNNFINTYLNKYSENEKADLNKKELIPMIIDNKNDVKDKLPFNTLKHYHRYLFHDNKDKCNCKEEEKLNINRKYNFSQSYESNSLLNNKISEYEIMELEGKKNYVATKLTKVSKEKVPKLNHRSKSLNGLNLKNLKKKQDFHYIMKHPFSNSFFCSSFINQLTENNNSYTNNFSEKFKNLINPLNDKDLTDKLHNLILNPNTSKIRNGELYLMYKNFPKGTFYNIYNNKNNNKNNNNNNINNNNNNDILYNEELKKLEKTKYRKYIIKLNKSIERARNIQRQLDILLYINKNNV